MAIFQMELMYGNFIIRINSTNNMLLISEIRTKISRTKNVQHLLDGINLLDFDRNTHILHTYKQHHRISKIK